MHIAGIMSNLNAWKILCDSMNEELNEIKEAIKLIDASFLEKHSNQESRKDMKLFSTLSIQNKLMETLKTKSWEINKPLHTINQFRKRWEIGLYKNGICTEIFFGKLAFLESMIYVKFPFLHKLNTFKVAIFIVPVNKLGFHLPIGVNTYESVSEILKEFSPIPIKYPFVIIGISTEIIEYSILEITSEIDNYLIEEIGTSLEESIFIGEKDNYDFKENISDNKKFSQEVCAFANLSRGGLIIMGISDSGDIVGINNDELDDLQLKMTSIIRDTCTPVPKFEFLIFNIQDKMNKSIIIIKIHEIERGPCMTSDKIYIRVGPSARPAVPDEIRKIVLRDTNH